MKIWLDDERPILEIYDKDEIDDNKDRISEYILCETYQECIDLLENDINNEITEIDLDHDLGYIATDEGFDYKTGYDVILWLEKRIWEGKKIPKIKVHTANPVARKKMIQTIECIEKTIERLEKEKQNDTTTI